MGLQKNKGPYVQIFRAILNNVQVQAWWSTDFTDEDPRYLMLEPYIIYAFTYTKYIKYIILIQPFKKKKRVEYINI